MEIGMKYITTVEKAIEEIETLQEFVFLAKRYDAKSLDQKIIKEYAYRGSISEVVKVLNSERSNTGFEEVDSSYVSSVIKSKPSDPLHKIIKTSYLKRTRHVRRKNN